VIPYSRQTIYEEDIQSVVDVLNSDWLTTGPAVDLFEEKLANMVYASHAIAVSSGTAALHMAMDAIGIKEGDEVIVPAITFAATANCVVYQGGTPVFVDVDPDTLLIDPNRVAEKITSKTKAIIGVDYAGQICDYDKLYDICGRNIKIVADSCQSLGAWRFGFPSGTLADITTFSFHPVKNITTGEGGMAVTNNASLARRMKMFRNHGINSDHRQRTEENSWYYEMQFLGYNYRITDIQCALGISQLDKLSYFIERRNYIAKKYRYAFKNNPNVEPLKELSDTMNAYHLFVARFPRERRDRIFRDLRALNVGVNVHHIPVHLHPFYLSNYATGRGLCPVAEAAYDRILSLPIFPSMTEIKIDYVINAVNEVTS
jgi:perosamine synthetase